MKKKEIVKFTGAASSLGTGEGMYEEDEQGNRRWIATCGCEAGSAGGAYGTFGNEYDCVLCLEHEVQEIEREKEED